MESSKRKSNIQADKVKVFNVSKQTRKLVHTAHNVLRRTKSTHSNANVKMSTMQQNARLARLWFHESKSIATVQKRFRLEYRNCRLPTKNSIKRWNEQLRSENLPH
ncbi:hypothetical protein AVEN_118723-1 [Araneus ventricosus]|uniref:DUF4817 domain-containing protein n=1 Tax=Araneus ventricosus TaxID=182803 RepID=A0A4Y2BVF4_ARAVE|nr:hypothetical protein AVEN_118723-1 [Araneus ventricosus]